MNETRTEGAGRRTGRAQPRSAGRHVGEPLPQASCSPPLPRGRSAAGRRGPYARARCGRSAWRTPFAIATGRAARGRGTHAHAPRSAAPASTARRAGRRTEEGGRRAAWRTLRQARAARRSAHTSSSARRLVHGGDRLSAREHAPHAGAPSRSATAGGEPRAAPSERALALGTRGIGGRGGDRHAPSNGVAAASVALSVSLPGGVVRHTSFRPARAAAASAHATSVGISHALAPLCGPSRLAKVVARRRASAKTAAPCRGMACGCRTSRTRCGMRPRRHGWRPRGRHLGSSNVDGMRVIDVSHCIVLNYATIHFIILDSRRCALRARQCRCGRARGRVTIGHLVHSPPSGRLRPRPTATARPDGRRRSPTRSATPRPRPRARRKRHSTGGLARCRLVAVPRAVATGDLHALHYRRPGAARARRSQRAYHRRTYHRP